MKRRQQQILSWLDDHPFSTAYEIAIFVADPMLKPTWVRNRLRRLQRRGFVLQRQLDRGWCVTPAGHAARIALSKS